MFKVGEVYKVTNSLRITFNGVTSGRDGFYKCIGFSQANNPVFQDGDKFFEAYTDSNLFETLKPTKDGADDE